MKRFFLFFSVLCLGLVSCENFNLDLGDLFGDGNAGESETYEIVLASSSLLFDAEGGEKEVKIEANVAYELLCEATWVECRQSENGMVVVVDSNPSELKRKSMVAVFNTQEDIYKSVAIEQDGCEPIPPQGVSLEKSEIAWDESVVKCSTTGNPNSSFEATLIGGGSFCYVQPAIGAVGDDFTLTFTKNTSNVERRAVVAVEFSDGYSKRVEVCQRAKTSEDVVDTYSRKWAEQPDKSSNKHYIHKTYYATLMDNRRVRNFSVCYDTVKMCSRWVAYPGHSVYRKWGSYQVGENNNSGRTNAWAFDDAVTQYAPSTDYNCAYEIVSKYDSSKDAYDTAKEPIIPHSRQADICFTNGFGWGWARGHMLPSSQRYNTWENNAQTCYATNIMVQQYDFNGGAWADVEALERNKNCSDTLYVVVGTLFENNNTITRFGRTIGVPSHCFKLLLRTKSGSTGKYIGDITSAKELICIGFLYENSEASKDATVASAAISVADIEKRSGFRFFRNLNSAIADEVKSQNKPSDWGL